MAAKAKPKVADRDEILVLLTTAARGGNVPAMRLLLAELRLDGIDNEAAEDFIDELALKREAALGA